MQTTLARAEEHSRTFSFLLKRNLQIIFQTIEFRCWIQHGKQQTQPLNTECFQPKTSDHSANLRKKSHKKMGLESGPKIRSTNRIRDKMFQ